MTAKTKTELILTILIMLFLISCHTETPTGIDNVDPSVKILTVYTDADTLYDSASGSAYTDFSDTLLTEKLYIKAEISDDQELYKVGIIAEDVLSGLEYVVTSSSAGTNGETVISTIYRDFPVVQDTTFQQFYLKLYAADETENTAVSQTKLGLYITKPYPMILFYEDLGLVAEIEGDSVDFRNKNGELAFIQFMSKGCLSCVEEAREMKAVYADTLSYDISKFSHSLFGNDTFTEQEFRDFKLRDERLPFNCFWDGDGSVKDFFESLIGKNIENQVFAVLPNGKIEEYDYLSGSFHDWIDMMYDTAYPNK